MASLPPVPTNISKRKTLSEQLDRLPDATEEEQIELIEEIQQQSVLYKGFRHNAPRTQHRQNHHLAEYTRWLLWVNRRAQDEFPTEHELDEFRLPSNPVQHDAMFERFRQFLLFVFKMTEPRSRASGQHIQYRTLVQYRDSLVFWVRYKARMRNSPFPNNARMFYIMTEAMRAVMKAFPNQGVNKRKAYLGLGELRELFDHDAIHCMSIEYAEQHWAAWCILRLTACRAGSICLSSRFTSNPPLKWSNLEFIPGSEPGQFDLVIHFENINLKKPHDPEAAMNQPGDDSLHVTIASPDANNLIFSAAHRLLVIALRRGILVGINSIDDLMNCTLARIPIKPEAMNDPLFYAGRARGAGIDMSSPLRVNALSEYLRKVARKVGYIFAVLGVTPIRRRALTDIVTRLGKDAARRIAGHSPESQTLERYYLQVGVSFKQTSALLEQALDKDDQQGFSNELRKKWAPLSTEKLRDESVQRTRGAALRIMTDRLALADADDNPTDNLDAAARRQYRARLRRIAQKALFEHEQKQQQLTIQEVRQRTEAIAASSFADAVLERALEIRAAQVESREDADGDVDMEENQNDEDEEGGEYDDEESFEGFGDDDGGTDESGNSESQEEQDLEDAALEEASRHITIPPEREMEMDSQTDMAASYRDQATAFMEILLDNSMNRVADPWAAREKTCPDCFDDETISVERKAYEYSSEAKLDNHLNGNTHTAEEKFKRAAIARFEANDEESWVCPYCEQAGQDRAAHFSGTDIPPSSFSKLTRLVAHVRASNAETDGRKHDELKDLGGWYDPALARRTDPQTAIKASQGGAKNLKKMGIELIKVRSTPGTEPYPHPHMPGLVKGMPNSEGIPSKFATSLSTGQQPQPPMPLKFATSLQYGAPSTSVGIPSAFQGSLALGSATSGTVTTPARTQGPPQKSTPRPAPPTDPTARRVSLGTRSMARPSSLSEPVMLSDNSKSSSIEDDEDDEDDEDEDMEEDGE
ncbi:unnamed protein product [Zymoseptoria tritici ST99CH_1A5]|uniref:Uncharacterized protein n=1 Tax=Zymoseptoria tritici ST99CH_1A5 TaxID=1276529 RepID=A0A1Y6LKB7_ZYMTR|nr:unnamed protein product [Zymoseptoria tritici ST99CH_1A5]